MKAGTYVCYVNNNIKIKNFLIPSFNQTYLKVSPYSKIYISAHKHNENVNR